MKYFCSGFSLKSLNLKDCGFEAIRMDETPGFENLENLWLDKNPFGDVSSPVQYNCFVI